MTLELSISAIDSYPPMSEKLFKDAGAMEQFKAMLAADLLIGISIPSDHEGRRHVYGTVFSCT